MKTLKRATYAISFLTAVKPKFNLKNKMKNWLKTNRWHFLGWLIFIVYENLLVAMTTSASIPLLTYVIHYSLNIALFYMHSGQLSRLLSRPKPAYVQLAMLVILKSPYIPP